MRTSSRVLDSTSMLGPRRASMLRAVVEAGIGCALLLAMARLLNLAGGNVGGVLANVPDFLSLLWLVAWPAWRLRPIEGGWGSRLGLGILRVFLAGAALTVTGALLIALLNPGVLGLFGSFSLFFWFLVFRALFAAAAAIARRVRQRLRWQLLVSHAAVIVLMLVALTSVGSIIGLGFVINGIASHPAGMATTVADDLQLARAVSPADRTRADRVLRSIYARRPPLGGEPALAGFAPTAFLPQAVVLVDLHGQVLAGRLNLGSDGKRTRPASWRDLGRAARALWPQARQSALHGRAVELSASGSEVVAEAPVRHSGGKVVAVVLLRTNDYRPTPGQLARIIVTIFGVTTIAVILITSLPMIGLSFLFSYLVARGLTRRLESLSGVATSIASGNLTERAPVTSGNEVGRLAEDVNQMADHLQTTMGALEQARAQAEEALRVRQELVANISHELRTPLATLRAHLETVEARSSVPAGSGVAAEGSDIRLPARTFAALQDETGRLESMVDDLFALSSAQAGAIEIRSEPVDVAALAGEIAALMRPLAQREGAIALSAEVPAGPVRAMADPGRLHQIIANLIRNAVRHTPDGGIIVLSVTRDGAWVVISVADTGEGIPAEHLPSIFERFYRSDPARSRATGGAGLGLAIVREFVELMGGRVEVESTVGEGTRFRVFLPAAT